MAGGAAGGEGATTDQKEAQADRAGHGRRKTEGIGLEGPKWILGGAPDHDHSMLKLQCGRNPTLPSGQGR